MTTAPAIEPERFTACPVLLAHPGADRMTDIAQVTPRTAGLAAS